MSDRWEEKAREWERKCWGPNGLGRSNHEALLALLRSVAEEAVAQCDGHGYLREEIARLTAEVERLRVNDRQAQRLHDDFRRSENRLLKRAEQAEAALAAANERAAEWEHKCAIAWEHVEKLEKAGRLLLGAYGEAHALYDLGECEGSLLMREALRPAAPPEEK